MIEQEILPEQNWAEIIEFPCGCSAFRDRTLKQETTLWIIDNFCNDHDPTIHPNETNNF